MVRAAAIVGLVAAFLFAGCGPKSIATGSVPFPAENPVFVDDTGKAIRGLPESPEPIRLVLLDFVWCPPCAEAWKAIREASREIPAGSVRVYRVLFDRERLLAGGGTAEVAPLRPVPPPDAGSLPVTTVTALPRPFRERFGVEQVPILLLMHRNGQVVKRWTGSFPSLPGAIVSEIKSLEFKPRSSAPPLPET
ncbi:MAG: thioredoxin family protein [Deltaproteobacteria bacterium]|nr:thioredoxin family protein [Deltaproteobacteria bacterium]